MNNSNKQASRHFFFFRIDVTRLFLYYIIYTVGEYKASTNIMYYYTMNAKSLVVRRITISDIKYNILLLYLGTTRVPTI